MYIDTYNITTPAGYVQPDVTQPVSETIFDALGRAIQSIAPDGSLTETSFNIINTQRGTLVKNPKGYVTQSYTDMWGQTVKVQPVTGPWTAYHYDVKGQLTSVDQVNADGVFATTSLTYDFGGRKLSMDDADMGLWTYAYDTLGNLVQQTDARGQVITMCYDTLNRLTGKAYNGSTCASPEISYTYGTSVGELGYRVGMVDLSGSTSWTYNQRGQVTAESKTVTGLFAGGTFSTQWAYNTAGMLTQMTYPGGTGGQAGETVYYSYNGQGAIESVASLTDTYLTHADYDAQGRLTEQVFSGDQLIKQYQYYPWAGGSAGSGGKLSQVLAGARGNLTLQNLSYNYDQNGNILTITDAMQTSTFTYDELDRLTSAQAVGGGLGEYPLETYQYDSLGRLWHKAGLEMTYNDAEHIHAVTATSTGSSFVYDPAGNMTTRDGQAITYNPEGKVASVSEGSTTTSYVFDGDGNRVLKIEAATEGGILTETFHVTIGNYYAHFEEFEDGQFNSTKYKSEYYYYAGSQRLAMRESVTYPTLPTDTPYMYFLGDHLGSTSLVVHVNGTLLTEQRYKPFGESRYRATSGFPTDFQFTGQRWEESTGLYDYVARMYDPITGHFISADTVFDGWDRYAYTRNNPIRYTDPSGHRSKRVEQTSQPDLSNVLGKRTGPVHQQGTPPPGTPVETPPPPQTGTQTPTPPSNSSQQATPSSGETEITPQEAPNAFDDTNYDYLPWELINWEDICWECLGVSFSIDASGSASTFYNLFGMEYILYKGFHGTGYIGQGGSTNPIGGADATAQIKIFIQEGDTSSLWGQSTEAGLTVALGKGGLSLSVTTDLMDKGKITSVGIGYSVGAAAEFYMTDKIYTPWFSWIW